jgi:hypothetical protein
LIHVYEYAVVVVVVVIAVIAHAMVVVRASREIVAVILVGPLHESPAASLGNQSAPVPALD